MRDRLRDKLRRSFDQPQPAQPSKPGDPDGSAPSTEPSSAPQGRTPPVRGGADLRSFLQRRESRRVGNLCKVDLPCEGSVVSNKLGDCFVRQLRYPADYVHGRRALATAQQVDWTVLAERAKDAAFEGARYDECLFLDTETTGLSGGAGTTVFMTGIGWFEADEFVLEQTFLRTFADEPAALQHVADRLEQRPTLVTFVGKSFDRHRLATRMTIHRVDAPMLEARHLDLYYLARRVWGKHWPDVKLRTVEHRELGLRRHDDLPGAEAPRAFLEWLRDATGPIDRVFEHNRLDVLSLVTLLGVLGSREGIQSL